MDTLSSDKLSLLLFEGNPSRGHPLGLGVVADVQQSSFRLGSFNLVSGDILGTLQQLHLGSFLRGPSLLVAAHQAKYTTPINIIARNTELKTFQVWLLAFPSRVSGSLKLSVILALLCFAK